ncbi:hypothetical protein SDC9_100291 [bioreactor metagenome]|uniref:Uncharacterized protein n=1 Tax=bioreactor metagenome TaxID=1076179 RepID=A0A645ARM8_9ZZZZ
MLLMPPMTMIKDKTVITAPVIQLGTVKVELIELAMELACVISPMPKEAMTANRANAKPSTEPNLPPTAFFITYIGPPDISPFSFTSRYLTASMHSENLEVMPNAAEISIQTSAPGPPAASAVATPTMLPVPIVAASAVISAENGETSPVPRLVVRASLLITL